MSREHDGSDSRGVGGISNVGLGRVRSADLVSARLPVDAPDLLSLSYIVEETGIRIRLIHHLLKASWQLLRGRELVLVEGLALGGLCLRLRLRLFRVARLAPPTHVQLFC